MSEEGKLAELADLAAVDDWSRWCYSHLIEWDIAHSGKWSTWHGVPSGAPNYLLLELKMTDIAGEVSEPLCVYTADDEITVASRVWHEHYPSPGDSDDEGLEAAKCRVEQWFRGDVRAAVFYEKTSWRGTGTIEADDNLQARLEELRRYLGGYGEIDRVEVRGPWASKDLVYAVTDKSIHF